MNWVRTKFLCSCKSPSVHSAELVGGNNVSDEFSKEEIARICKWFHLNNYKEMHRLTPYHFKNRWEGMLTDGLSAQWTEMLFRDYEGEDEMYDQVWDRLHCLMVKQCKGALFDRAAITLTLLEPDADAISRNKIVKYVDNVMESFSLLIKSCDNTELDSWTKCCTLPEANSLSSLQEFILNNLTYREVLSLEELVLWLETASVFKDILGEVCSLCVSINPPARQLIPKPLCSDTWQSFINLGQLIALSSQLHQEDTVEWRLLYSRKIHGGNIMNLLQQTMNKGSTIILIKDEDQCVYGAFASASWTSNREFYGDDNCFIFTLCPKIQIFPSSRENNNYQYCYKGKEFIPSGLGLGGILGNFGIWINDNLDTGKCSNRCVTFLDYVMPSRKTAFKLSDLQVWATRDKCECKGIKDSTGCSDPRMKSTVSNFKQISYIGRSL